MRTFLLATTHIVAVLPEWDRKSVVAEQGCIRLVKMACAVVLAALPATLVSARAEIIRDDVGVAAYNALALQPQYDSAGYVANSGATGSFCSGTLVSATTFLTAAHCVTDSKSYEPNKIASDLTVGFDTNIPFTVEPNNVSAIHVDPLWQSSSGTPINDIALLTLSNPITSITPALLGTGDPSDLIGTSVGYGYQDTGLGTGYTANGNNYGFYLYDANSRLATNNVIDDNDEKFGLATDFDNPAGTTSSIGSNLPLPLEGNTCFGDSGGPLFVTTGGQTLDVGDLNGSAPNPYGTSCFYGDVSNWAPFDLSANDAYIESIDPSVTFLALPESVPEPTALSLMGIGILGLAAAHWQGRRRASLTS